MDCPSGTPSGLLEVQVGRYPLIVEDTRQCSL